MNENKYDLLRQQDQNLREALRQEATELPPMPDDLNDRVLQRIGSQRPQRRPVWLYTAIAAAAGVALLLSLHLIYKNNEQAMELPLVAQQAKPSHDEPTISQHDSQAEHTAEPKDVPRANPATTAKRKEVQPPRHAADIRPEVALPEERATAEELATAEERATAEEPILIAADKQALADIYLAEVALQVAYQQQERQQAVEAYAASLVGEEPSSATPIIAF